MEIKDGGILIISGPRTGSTNLMKSISSAYNKRKRFEPDILKKQPPYDSSKDVVKFIPIWEKHFYEDYKVFYDSVVEHIKEFNTIIILNRRNKLEQTESLYVQQTNNNKNHNVKWGLEKTIDKESSLYKTYELYIKKLDNILDKLSKDLNTPIDYYEDVYKNKTLINKNIKLDLEYFKPKYKLRQEIKPKRLV